MKHAIDRRDFALGLAAAASAAPAGVFCGAVAAADDPKPPAPTDRLLSLLAARFPDRLSDSQWKEVRRKIEGQLRAGEELRQFSLKNADEPATVFSAYRGG